MKAYRSSRTPASEEVMGLEIPIPVQSSWLASVAYNAERTILQVELRTGALYQYTQVPQEVYQALLQADSLGGHLNRHIRGQFPHTLLRQA